MFILTKLSQTVFSTWISLFMLLVFYDMITIRKQRGLLKQFAKNSLTWLQPIFPLSPTFSTGQANVEPAFLEQKKTYGEDYYEAAMTSVEKYSRQVRVPRQPLFPPTNECLIRTFFNSRRPISSPRCASSSMP